VEFAQQVPTVPLRNGAALPLLGLGTWPLKGEEASNTIVSAVEAGYRLFDTAEGYGNESSIGVGLRRSGIDRGEIFVTSKFDQQWHSVEGVRQALAAATARLGLDYLDMFMVHWPMPAQGRFVDAVAGLVELLRDGRIRAVGTSNFKPAHLRALADAGLVPDVNQIQLDPQHSRLATVALHRELGIQTQSWSPLGRQTGLRENPVLVGVAAEHGRSTSQVILRWHVQQGFAAVPKASNRAHLEENLRVFDFVLTDEQMERIAVLESGEADILDSDSYGHSRRGFQKAVDQLTG
jgi:2,5-diketo-D-gluconate reductase A